MSSSAPLPPPESSSTALPTEWSQVESSMEALAPSSADLFDGDILGDELMDIYNAAVVGGGDDTDAMNDIPSLLGNDDLTSKHDAMTPSTGLDDGFGTFRPSTSFNDLPSLDADMTSGTPIAPAPVGSGGTSLLAPVVSSTSLAPSPVYHLQGKAGTTAGGAASTATAKRKAANESNTSNKRKNTSTKKSGTTSKKKTAAGTSKKAKTPGTPNPLTTSQLQAAAAAAATSAANALAAQSTAVDIASKIAVTSVAPIQPVPATVPSQTVVTPATATAGAAQSSARPAPVAAPTVSTGSAAAAPAATKPLTITKAAAQVSKTVQNPVVPAPVTSSVPTEADFKGVAQAAVNNLIMNAGSQKTTGGDAKTSATSSSDKVDTSSEHVKALTGSNWVSVCGGGAGNSTSASTDAAGAATTAASGGAAAGTDAAAQQAADLQNKNRRQNLTPDERARQNRDRNREHARNTRLRKKAYVEELKRTLTALVNQRDAAETEKRHAAQRELEQREVRFRVLEEFLKLRGRNEVNSARWAAIFEDGMTLTLPVTDFRGMVQNPAATAAGNVSVHEQVLTGVTEIMEDSAHAASFFQGLGKNTGNESSSVSLVYNCDRKNFFMDSCTAMMEFTASTVGAVEKGATAELSMKGNARATFSPASNKLITVAMTFDTGAIMSQINNLVAKPGHEIEADAAQAAANEADAILDSLQMPHIEPSSIPGKINVVPPSSASSTGSEAEKGDSSDDDKEDPDDTQGMSTRRVARRKD